MLGESVNLTWGRLLWSTLLLAAAAVLLGGFYLYSAEFASVHQPGARLPFPTQIVIQYAGHLRTAAVPLLLLHAVLFAVYVRGQTAVARRTLGMVAWFNIALGAVAWVALYLPLFTGEFRI